MKDASRRRRGRDADIPRWRAAATPRLVTWTFGPRTIHAGAAAARPHGMSTWQPRRCRENLRRGSSVETASVLGISTRHSAAGPRPAFDGGTTNVTRTFGRDRLRRLAFGISACSGGAATPQPPPARDRAASPSTDDTRWRGDDARASGPRRRVRGAARARRVPRVSPGRGLARGWREIHTSRVFFRRRAVHRRRFVRGPRPHPKARRARGRHDARVGRPPHPRQRAGGRRRPRVPTRAEISRLHGLVDASLHGLSASSPPRPVSADYPRRRRRDQSPRTIHVVAAASPRPVST